MDRTSLIIHDMVKKYLFVYVFIIVIKLGKNVREKPSVGYKFLLYEPPLGS